MGERAPIDDRARWYAVRPIFLITLLAALLRVTFITQPAIWGDEGLTYSRVCGTYRELIDILQRDGFVPLHYELYWAIARVFRLTPVVLRAVPIVSGILFVPAMYFLARQLVCRRTANLVALFTAFSAYMLIYSRDAKMYPHFWLCAALMMAFYFWWLREPARVLWLAWIACGVAATGLHAAGFLLVALLPVFLITDRRIHWKKTVCVLIGIAVIGAGPAGYFLKFNRLIDRSEEENFNEASGTMWVKPYNAGRDGPSHVMYCATAFLFGWEKPGARDEATARPERLYWYTVATWAVMGALALGAFPWKRRAFAPSPGLLTNAHTSTLSAQPRGEGDCERREVLEKTEGPQQITMIAFWISAWLIVPVYFFYCRSVSNFDSPQDWIGLFSDIFSRRWLGMFGCFIAAVAVLEIVWSLRYIGWFSKSEITLTLTLSRGTGRGDRSAAVLLALILVVLQLFVLPRHASPTDRFLSSLIVFLPAFAFYQSGNAFLRRLIAFTIFVASTALVLMLCQAVYSFSSKDLLGSIWVPRYIAIVWPAFAIVLAILIGRLPGRGLQIAVVGLLLILNVDRFVQRVMGNFNVDDAGKMLVTGSEPPVDQVARDVVDSDTVRRERIAERTVLWHPRSTTRVYVFFQHPNLGGPGDGTILSTPGRYYLAILGNVNLTPQEFRRMSPFEAEFFEIRQETDPYSVAADVARNSNLTKIIIWDRTNSDSQSTTDVQIALLGRSWTLASVQTFEVSQHWMDLDLGVYRRREYVRKVDSRQ